MFRVKWMGRVVCAVLGHRRGKRIFGITVGTQKPEKIFKCPRCGRETRYKVKSAALSETVTP
jgi:transcription elongation factor Elf1